MVGIGDDAQRDRVVQRVLLEAIQKREDIWKESIGFFAGKAMEKCVR